jgi:hypothetical protein
MGRKSKHNYIDNKKFLADLREFYERDDVKKYMADPENNERPQAPDSIGESFMKIADNFAKLPSWSFLPYKEDLISDGIIACVNALFSFDVNKSSNPFSYFTTVIYHSFLHAIKKEKLADAAVISQIESFYHGFAHSCEYSPHSGQKEVIINSHIDMLMRAKEERAAFGSIFDEKKPKKKRGRKKKSKNVFVEGPPNVR